MRRMRVRSVVVVAFGLVLAAGGADPQPQPQPQPQPPAPTATATPRTVPPPSQRPAAADDAMFRPTVVIRNGTAQGSGTVVASIDDETLILTAAHVVLSGNGPLTVELHRYNFGLERFSRIAGGWPRKVPASVIAADPSGDLAVLRIRRMKRLPFVARLTSGVEEPARGTVVTSVGIDLGEHLSSWLAYVGGVEWITLEKKKEDRPFLITTRAPEHGRSGGGLFLPDGELVGVCVGRVEENRKKGVGIFASGASIRRLLRDHDLDTTITRSEAMVRQANAARRAGPPPATTPAVALPVTPTQARPGRRGGGT